MIMHSDRIVMKAVVICFKPYLKPVEAMIYCDLGRTQFAKKFQECGVFKNDSGYFKREELDATVGEPLGGNQADWIA